MNKQHIASLRPTKTIISKMLQCSAKMHNYSMFVSKFAQCSLTYCACQMDG